MKLFKRTPIYIKISFDRIEITNLDTGATISKMSKLGFSTARIIVANFNVIDSLIREVVKELIKSKFVFQVQLKVLIQQIEEVDGGLTEIEKRALRNLAEQAGGTYVSLVDHSRKLSEEEALLVLGTST